MPLDRLQYVNEYNLTAFSNHTLHCRKEYMVTTFHIKYNHPTPSKSQHPPHAHHEIVYGANEQLLPDVDSSPLLDDVGVKCVEGIVCPLLSYSRAADNNLLASLSTVSSQQACATEKMPNQSCNP